MGKVLCLKCQTILESKHRHDFQRCKCENETFVDGGYDYLRYGGVDIAFVCPITETKEETEQFLGELEDRRIRKNKRQNYIEKIKDCIIEHMEDCSKRGIEFDDGIVDNVMNIIERNK